MVSDNLQRSLPRNPAILTPSQPRTGTPHTLAIPLPLYPRNPAPLIPSQSRSPHILAIPQSRNPHTLHQS